LVPERNPAPSLGLAQPRRRDSLRPPPRHPPSGPRETRLRLPRLPCDLSPLRLCGSVPLAVTDRRRLRYETSRRARDHLAKRSHCMGRAAWPLPPSLSCCPFSGPFCSAVHLAVASSDRLSAGGPGAVPSEDYSRWPPRLAVSFQRRRRQDERQDTKKRPNENQHDKRDRGKGSRAIRTVGHAEEMGLVHRGRALRLRPRHQRGRCTLTGSPIQQAIPGSPGADLIPPVWPLGTGARAGQSPPTKTTGSSYV